MCKKIVTFTQPVMTHRFDWYKGHQHAFLLSHVEIFTASTAFSEGCVCPRSLKIGTYLESGRNEAQYMVSKERGLKEERERNISSKG